MASTLVTWLYLLAIVAAAVFLIYRRSLPRPIPGNIPYDKAAAVRPFGDIPTIIAHPEPLRFFLEKCHEFKSPIFQLFLEPFGRPTVFITDTREAHDILARRTKEFDRAKFFADIFVAVAPNNQVCLPTNEQWHSNRKLMADTMSPAFLKNSAAPAAQAVFTTFVELWRARATLAKGRPFSAEKDIDCAMLDVITAIAFGSSSHATEVERDYAQSDIATVRESVVDGQTVAEFDRQPPPQEHSATETIAHSCSISAESPLGAWHHWAAMKLTPSLRAAEATKEKIFERQVNIALEKFSNPEAAGEDVKSAADLIISKEINMARKEGRQPNVKNAVIKDELFGFVVAGYDTTATTIKWGVKYLTKHQNVQARLRAEMRAAFKDAAASGGLPSAEDIAKDRPAYLDAVIEEILRLGNPGVNPIRTATQDVTIFGHHIPKGTEVFLMSIGPGNTEPPLPVDESIRSKTSQDTIDTAYNGNWDPNTLGEFLPERWLQKNEKGELEFNPRAGCQQTFGGGLRGCFGRRLAYVVMRIVFAYIVWDFDLQPIDGDMATFDNKVVLTSTPWKCYVKLARAGQHGYDMRRRI